MTVSIVLVSGGLAFFSTIIPSILGSALVTLLLGLVFRHRLPRMFLGAICAGLFAAAAHWLFKEVLGAGWPGVRLFAENPLFVMAVVSCCAWFAVIDHPPRENE